MEKGSISSIRAFFVCLEGIDKNPAHNEEDREKLSDRYKTAIAKELKKGWDDLEVDYIIETLNQCDHCISVIYHNKEYAINSALGPSTQTFETIRDALWDYMAKIDTKKLDAEDDKNYKTYWAKKANQKK